MDCLTWDWLGPEWWLSALTWTQIHDCYVFIYFSENCFLPIILPGCAQCGSSFSRLIWTWLSVYLEVLFPFIVNQCLEVFSTLLTALCIKIPAYSSCLPSLDLILKERYVFTLKYNTWALTNNPKCLFFILFICLFYFWACNGWVYIYCLYLRTTQFTSCLCILTFLCWLIVLKR